MSREAIAPRSCALRPVARARKAIASWRSPDLSRRRDRRPTPEARFEPTITARDGGAPERVPVLGDTVAVAPGDTIDIRARRQHPAGAPVERAARPRRISSACSPRPPVAHSAFFLGLGCAPPSV
jgi:hypothetical protein